MHIRDLSVNDTPGLEKLIEHRVFFLSPKRNISIERVEHHQKLFYRSLLFTGAQLDSISLITQWNNEILQGLIYLFSDYGDNLYSKDQGTVVDVICNDSQATNQLLEQAEQRFRSMHRRFIAALVHSNNHQLRGILKQRGYVDEYYIFLQTIKPSCRSKQESFIMKKADYGDAGLLLDIGGSSLWRSLSNFRYSSENERYNDYMKGHAFDWWHLPVCCSSFLIVDISSEEVLGFLTIELDRSDPFTGQMEAHLIDVIFKDFSVQERLMSSLLGWVNDFLHLKGYQHRLWMLPATDRESLSLMEAVDRQAELEKIQMVKKIG